MPQVVLAANGRDAVAAHGKQTFQLIFMDVNIPIMDGFEATRQIRQNPVWPGEQKMYHPWKLLNLGPIMKDRTFFITFWQQMLQLPSMILYKDSSYNLNKTDGQVSSQYIL